jgi:hypothetical protein
MYERNWGSLSYIQTVQREYEEVQLEGGYGEMTAKGQMEIELD